MAARWKRLFCEDNRLRDLQSVWQDERRDNPNWQWLDEDYFAWTNVPVETLRAWCRLLDIRLPAYTVESHPPGGEA